MGDKKEITKKKRKNESQKELLYEIDLAGLDKWSRDEQQEAWELITEYVSIFAMSNVDLCKTFLVTHSIILTYNIPFRE